MPYLSVVRLARPVWARNPTETWTQEDDFNSAHLGGVCADTDQESDRGGCEQWLPTKQAAGKSQISPRTLYCLRNFANHHRQHGAHTSRGD
jgi:hypothetical protein